MKARWAAVLVTAGLGGMGAFAVPPVLMAMTVSAGGADSASGYTCGEERTRSSGEVTALPDPAQRANARTIIDVGRRLNIPERGWVIAIATAKVESGLVNVNYGDRDSLGLFQQRARGWGTAAQRTDPATAATMFYTGGKLGAPGLTDITGWQLMPIGAAAQAVQVSAFPDRYGQQEAFVRKVVAQAVGSSEPKVTCKPKPPRPAAPSAGRYPLDDLARINAAGNGRIPVSLLPAVPWSTGHRLRPDALNELIPLDAAYKERFGRHLCITDSYRTYAEQVDVYARKPGLAARPGTSNHGLGRALDLCGGIQSFDSPEHVWLAANGPRYGWRNPPWALRYGSRPEAWHFSWRTDN